MPLTEFELHPNRLSTTDSKGRRIFLYPADVRGFFRRRRTLVQAILVIVFLILPWIRISGHQALLLDIAERRFEIFGLSLRAHNAPLLLFVLSASAFGLFFATAVWGRVWCGWACPQTVFIDGVFRRIERWIEGPALERRKLNQSPLSFKKFVKKTIKWIFYGIATLTVTHSFLAYFVGTDRLAEMILRSPSENWGSFLFMVISSGIILFDFAWFREQFCTLVCPYGRFQSVLMDSSSMIVAYDFERGEPRSTPQAKALAKTHNSKLGDCVNCYRCVQVCPTGIDIRRGVQMECIACTACIDACDEVMTKIKKPTGLIRYDSLSSQTRKKSSFSLRAGIYFIFCFFSILALVVSLYLVKPIDVQILRAKDALYTTQVLDQGKTIVMNHLKLELSNQSGSNRNLIFETSSETEKEIQLITAVQPLLIDEGKVMHVDIFVRFPKELLIRGKKKIQLVVKEQADQDGHRITVDKEVDLVGPY